MTTPEESVWLKLLQDSTNRLGTSESLVVLIGDTETNKRTLLQYLCENGHEKQRSFPNDEGLQDLLEFINYDHFDIDSNSLEAQTARVNIWTVDQRMIQRLPEILKVKSNEDTKLLFLMALDLSKGDEVLLSFKRWTKHLISFLQVYFQEVIKNPEKQQLNQARWYQYISNVRTSKGGKVTFEVENNGHAMLDREKLQASPFKTGAEHFPFPVIAVGYNHNHITTILQSSSSMNSTASSTSTQPPSSSTANASSTANINDLLQVNRFKELVGKLRYYCLELGIAIALIPSFSELPSSASSSTKEHSNVFLKQYLVHRLFPERVSLELTLEEKLDRLFVPSGFDSVDLIQLSSGVKYSEKDFSFAKWISSVPSLDSDAPRSTTASTSTSPVPMANAGMEVDNEQDWLQGLHSFVAQSVGEISKLSMNLSDQLLEEEPQHQEKRKTLTSNLSNSNLAHSATSTNPSSKNVSPHSAKVDQASTATSTANATANTTTTSSKVLPRRASARTNATTAANTQDFFKSLMEGNPKK